MSMFGVQGHVLEVTVVGCSKLKNTEWISRQDPYVCLEYATTKYRTRTCTDGGRNAAFQEKFVFTLIDGLREIYLAVWNSNTISLDAFIGSGRVQLLKVLSQGYDDSAWPLQDKKGKYAGEVRLIMHYANASKPTTAYPPSAPPAMSYGIAPHVPPSSTAYPPTVYPPMSCPQSQAYPSYPLNISGYSQPPLYNQPATFPQPYPPHSVYPPPPPPHDPRYNPPGPYPPPAYPPYPY